MQRYFRVFAPLILLPNFGHIPNEKKGPFFPKVGQIIPKLIGVIVGKNPDLVTGSGNVFYIMRLHIQSSVRFSSRFFVHSVFILF